MTTQATQINNAQESSENQDINEILRGELSAKQAYEQVMEKIDNEPETMRLRQLKADHESAIHYWKDQARITGNIPEEDSSVWGTAVEAFVGASKLFGNESALRALKKGEEHGLSNYEKMVESENLTPFQKDEIRNTFIPRQRTHINEIEGFIKMQ